MRLQISRLGQLENICVKGGHFWSNVIEEVGLLHMVTLHSDRDLLVQIRLVQVEFDQILLRYNQLD